MNGWLNTNIENTDSLVKTKTPIPTYIKESICCDEDEDVLLIYKKISIETLERSPNIPKEADTSLDLTGNPLEVDLSAGDSSLNMSFHEHVDLWRPEEASYGSLDLKNIRKYINGELSQGTCLDSYAYGLCNGKDNKMVILGCKQTEKDLIRIQGFIEGFCGIDEGNERLIQLKNYHLNNLGSIFLSFKLGICIKGVYNLYGFKHITNQSNSLLTSKFSGSISLKVSWSSLDFKMPQTVDTVRMTIQTITGHNESQLNPFFKELNLLKSYINILSKPSQHTENVILCESSENHMDIVNSYERIFNTRNPGIFLEEELDFDHLRFEVFTDKLWKILIRCGTLGDLKFCLDCLFHDLALSKLSINLNDFITDNSLISEILLGISKGTMAVPSLTPLQCLMCLIELGTEKLKKDYSSILTHCNCLDGEEIEKFWEIPEIKTSKSSVVSSRLTKSISHARVIKNRCTIAPNASILNIGEAFNKYNRLTSMHVACDVLALCSKASFLQTKLVERVKRCLINNEIKVNLNKPLFEVEVELDKNSLKHVTLLNPVSLNVKFTSLGKRDRIETIFHHTTKKLFPPSIFDDYEIPSDLNTNSHYYVSKFVRYTKTLLQI